MNDCALPPTPAREKLVELVQAAIDRARARQLQPTSVYLTPADGRACGLTLHSARDRAGDPPRVLGLRIYRIAGKGRNRMYCKSGLAISLPAIIERNPG